MVDRREHLREAQREDDHADHLHHRGQPEDPVVGVVCRREPRIVDPGPAGGEGGEREAGDAGGDVVLRHVVRQLIGGDAERDDERQVVEQLERRGAAVPFRRVAAAEPPPVVGTIVDLDRGHRADSAGLSGAPPNAMQRPSSRQPAIARARVQESAISVVETRPSGDHSKLKLPSTATAGNDFSCASRPLMGARADTGHERSSRV